MSNCVIKTIFIALLTVLAGLSMPHIAQGEQYAQGDFDKDGDVDFADFLVFANNFGKPITQQTFAETETDTVIVTVRDTVTVTDAQDKNTGVQVGKMFGYWMIQYEIPNHLGPAFNKEKKDAFLFHHTNGLDENTAYGKPINHRFISPFAHTEKETKVTYLPDEDKYILIDRKHIGIKELTYQMSKTGMYDLEIKFSIEYETLPDMSKLINLSYATPASVSWKTINEPIVKVDYMRVFIETENRYVNLIPINGGLMPCSRQEYMNTSERANR